MNPPAFRATILPAAYPDVVMIQSLDHLVLTVADVAATTAFYTTVLGMTAETFDGSRTALTFGQQKINLHPAGHEIAPHAVRPTPGSADLCFLTDRTVEQLLTYLAARQMPVELGPVARTGATRKITAIYLRDPDGNLIELAAKEDERGVAEF